MSETIKLPFLDIEIGLDELKEISLKELELVKVSPGPLYLKSKSNKLFLLKRPGEHIDSSFIEKYSSKGIEKLHIYKITSQSNQIILLLEEIKKAVLPLDKEKAVAKFIEYIKDHYWEDSKSNLLDITVACGEVFWRFDNALIDKIHNLSLIVFSRANLVASLSVILNMCLGYKSFEFLSDVYHAAFLLDYGLLNSKFDYHMALACDYERKKPTSGVQYLAKNLNTQEHLKTFLQHPNVGKELIEKDYNSLFFNKDIVRIITKHHENSYGSGFPRGIGQTELSDWEASIIVFDHIIAFDEFIYQRKDEQGLKELFRKLDDEDISKKLPVRRLTQRFFDSMCRKEAA